MSIVILNVLKVNEVYQAHKSWGVWEPAWFRHTQPTAGFLHFGLEGMERNAGNGGPN
jgi:hypothetical protein